MSLQELSTALKHMAGKHPQKTHAGSRGSDNDSIAGVPILEYVTDISNSKADKGFFITADGKVLPVVDADHWTTATKIRNADPEGSVLGNFNPSEYDSMDMYAAGTLTGSYIPGSSELNIRVHKLNPKTISTLKKLMKSGVLPTVRNLRIDSMERHPGYFSPASLQGMSVDQFLKNNSQAIIASALPPSHMKRK